MNERDPAEPTLHNLADKGSVRHIRDETGQLWTVTELISTGYDRRESRSLVFGTDEVIRRVRNYPSDWRSLSDMDLYALSLTP